METLIAQKLLTLSTGDNSFKLGSTSKFDHSDVIVSESYHTVIDSNGKMLEMKMYLRIRNTNKNIFDLTLYEMPSEALEEYQNAVLIANVDYFERTIKNLSNVIKILNEQGYEFDNKIRVI